MLTECKAGYYMDTNVCTACAQGTYREQVGATSVSDCLVCPAGDSENTLDSASTAASDCSKFSDKRIVKSSK